MTGRPKIANVCFECSLTCQPVGLLQLGETITLQDLDEEGGESSEDEDDNDDVSAFKKKVHRVYVQ